MKTWMCWTVAALLTAASAVWQRASGPSYPARGTVSLAGQAIAVSLARTAISGRTLEVKVPAPLRSLQGEIAWRRYPTSDPWQLFHMTRQGDELLGSLPTQPPAGKVEYELRLRAGGEQATFPARAAVARFRGEVPAAVLVPHVLLMFLGMLLAARTGLEALLGRPRLWPHALATLGVMVVGGLLLGPAVQKHAFGAWWTGVPFGWDLTDNKTLVAVVAWVVAVALVRAGRGARAGVLAAAVVTLVVFAIPHSTMGSQLDWSTMQQPLPEEQRRKML